MRVYPHLCSALRPAEKKMEWSFASQKGYSIANVSDGLMAAILSSRRDGAIVARHEVPGTAPPKKSRPVGYGLIRACVRTDFDLK
jgi:hypothetical protein